MHSEKERLKKEVRAYKEAKSIVDKKHKIGYNTYVEGEEEIYKRNYPRYRHLVDLNPDELENQIERLERDLRMIQEDDLFVEVLDEGE